MKCASWATRTIPFLSLSSHEPHRPHAHFLDSFIGDRVEEGIIPLSPHFVFTLDYRSEFLCTASRHKRWWWLCCIRRTQSSWEMWNSRPEREEFLRSSHADRSFFRSEIHTRATQLSHCDIVERSFHLHSGTTRWSAGHSSDSRIPFEWYRTWMGLETCDDDTIDSHTLGTPLCEKERSNTRGTERCHTLENDCREEYHRKTEYTQNRSCQLESTSWFVLFSHVPSHAIDRECRSMDIPHVWDRNRAFSEILDPPNWLALALCSLILCRIASQMQICLPLPPLLKLAIF